MKRRPRVGGGSRWSRRDRGESYFREGPRGSEAVRTVPSRGSSLLRTDGARSRRSGREAWLRTELARLVKGRAFEGGEVLLAGKAGLIVS